MKYSYFTIDQILETCFEYEDIYNRLLALLTDERRKEQLRQIMFDGGIGEFSVSTSLCKRDNPAIDARRRIELAYMLVRNPELFDRLLEQKINVFHGTNINALPSILEFGMHSLQDSERLGIYVSTGEEWSRNESKKRSFISFTDDLYTAEKYAAIDSTEKKKKESFGIILGTTTEDINSERVCSVSSDIPEIGVMNNFPTEKIRFIIAPPSKVEIVRQMVGDRPIEVLGMNDMKRKFYYVDDYGKVYISEESYQELQKEIREKQFEKEEMRSLASKRSLSRIQKMVGKLRGWMKGEEKDDRKTNESIARR